MIGQYIYPPTDWTARASRPLVPGFCGVRFRSKLAVACLGVVLFGLMGPAAAQDGNLAFQLQRIRRDLSDLQAYIYSGKVPERPAVPSAMPAPGGDGASAARLQVQIQNLEMQMRELTGRVEEVEFKVSTLKDRLEKMIADVDQRFLDLETAVAGKQTSAPPAGGAAVAGAPQDTPKTAETPGTRPITSVGQPWTPADGQKLEPGQQVLGTLSRKGAAAVKPPIETLPDAAGGKPPAPSGPPGSQIAAATEGTPQRQYERAFALLQRREYDKAANAFKVFADGNPGNPLASNALYWLGETYYFQKNYADAARVFLDGFKRYPKGNKAPDNLFKLGKALAAIDEKQPACAAWSKLLKTFPNTNERLLGNARGERARVGCS